MEKQQNNQEEQQSQNTKETTSNLPPPHIQEQIRKLGSPEQVAELEKKLKEQNIHLTQKGRDKAAEYFKQISKEEENKTVKDLGDEALKHLRRKAVLSRQSKPKEIDYKLTKRIFWLYYSELVQQETKLPFEKIVLDDHLREAFRNICHWIIGSDKGEYDPNKSLFIYGDLGVGKSTLALTAHYVLDYYKKEFSWSERYFKFVSMDELFLETYSNQSLNKIGRLGKNSWCLDELRSEHLTYKHYGMEIYIISDILTARHQLWKREGTQTVITSNIPMKRLNEELQDERLFDRINQQYNAILLKGSNKRNIKRL